MIDDQAVKCFALSFFTVLFLFLFSLIFCCFFCMFMLVEFSGVVFIYMLFCNGVLKYAF